MYESVRTKLFQLSLTILLAAFAQIQAGQMVLAAPFDAVTVAKGAKTSNVTLLKFTPTFPQANHRNANPHLILVAGRGDGDKEQANKNGKKSKPKAAKRKPNSQKANKHRAVKQRANKPKAFKRKANKPKAFKRKANKRKAFKPKANKRKAANRRVVKQKAAKRKFPKRKIEKRRAFKPKVKKQKSAKRNIRNVDQFRAIKRRTTNFGNEKRRPQNNVKKLLKRKTAKQRSNNRDSEAAVIQKSIDRKSFERRRESPRKLKKWTREQFRNEGNRNNEARRKLRNSNKAKVRRRFARENVERNARRMRVLKRQLQNARNQKRFASARKYRARERRFRNRFRNGRSIFFYPPVPYLALEEYILDASYASYDDYVYFLGAPPLVEVTRRYTLNEIVENPHVRWKVRSVDLRIITFEFGSSELTDEAIERLEIVADAILRILEDDPTQVFLIEGHTDAVGSSESNLELSTERAAIVLEALVRIYGVPAASLEAVGYGEQYLWIDTPKPNARNRRVVVRGIGELLGQSTSQNRY